MKKSELRKHLRSLYEGDQARNAQSKKLCEHILTSDVYQHSQVIAGYMPLSHEADVMPVIKEALRCGKKLALPLCSKPPEMTLRLVTSLDQLSPGKYGLLEPSVSAPIIEVNEIDFILVPLEGVDRKGFRLGKGGGYYDRLLADCMAYTLGCALSWQWADQVPRDTWDIPLHAVADDQGIHEFYV